MLNLGLASSARLSSQLSLEILSCARIADRPLHWPSLYMGTEDLNSSPHASPEIALASGPFPELFHLSESPTEPGTPLLARLAGQLTLGILLSLPLQCWHYTCATLMPGS